jgi:hypothetical protein
MVKRITDHEASSEPTPAPAKGFGLKRAMSKVDVSSTSMLLRTAFSLIFKQCDNFLHVSQSISSDKQLLAS